jgi:hypothetical protein
MEITIQNALCQALINSVGKIYGFYDYTCPACDDEIEDAECICQKGADEFKEAQNDMFATYLAIKKGMDENTKKE